MPRRPHEIPALTILSPSLTCPVCDEPLLFHQPDPRLPERLLSTCTACRAWFVVSDDGMVRLPFGDETWEVWPHGDVRGFTAPISN
jgi:hypothetical protein